MKISQRDVVETNFLLPNGEFKPHMAVVVSNEDLATAEGIVYLVLITSKDYNRQYCYELNEDMIDFQLTKKSYVKCHILVANMENSVFNKIGRMKLKYFNEMVDKIIESIF
ncbi:hypothetical protein AGMMS4957_06840 [Bacteroidia bacterium]|nr:hypothetical protein AGMMS4957_06840 [Bacteroidia bacterium]